MQNTNRNKNKNRKLLVVALLTLIFGLIFTVIIIPRVHAPMLPLHTEGRYIKDSNGNIVILRGVFKAEFVDSCTGWWPRPGQNITDGYYDFYEEGVNGALQAMKDWGCNIMATYFWANWWINDSSTTEMGGTTSHSFRHCLNRTIELAQEYGIYVSIRVYSPSNIEGRVEFPFPTGMSYEHDGSIFPNSTAFANFWADLAQELSVYPNVIFNLYDEPATNRDAWINATHECVTAIRNRGVNHIVMSQWGYCGEMDWVDEYLEKGKRTDHLVFFNHIYRYHGTFDSINKSTDLIAIRNYMQADNIPRYAYPPTGMHYKHLVEVNNLPMWVGAIGAFEGDTDDDEYTCVKNCYIVLNEMGIGYVAYQWQRSDYTWPLQNHTTAIQPPNRVGQALIDAIASGVPSTVARFHITHPSYFPSKIGSYITFDTSLLPLAFSTLYRDTSTRWYFNDTWVTTTTDITVTYWEPNANWLNYTSSSGTQQFYVNEPNKVYFDDVEQIEGTTWNYSAGVLTITPSGTDVGVTWAGVGQDLVFVFVATITAIAMSIATFGLSVVNLFVNFFEALRTVVKAFVLELLPTLPPEPSIYAVLRRNFYIVISIMALVPIVAVATTLAFVAKGGDSLDARALGGLVTLIVSVVVGSTIVIYLFINFIGT